MVLKVNNLVTGDARAAYKNINFDVRNYKKLQMEVHAEAIAGYPLNDNDLTVFIRMGSDYKDNFYEYELPLKLTQWNGSTATYLPQIVWPAENHIEIDLADLQRVKQARNDNMRVPGSNVSNTMVFPFVIDGKKGTYYVSGNPNMSNIKTIMIGVRHPYNANKVGDPKSAEVWVDELRVTDFNEKGGWAANLRTTTRLSDFGTVSVAGNISTPGFGSIDSKLNNRSLDETYQYDIAANFELGKFFPAKAKVQIPMYVGLSEIFINPEYNPLDPDILLKASLSNAKTQHERDSIKYYAQDYTRRKSLNFTNVKINKQKGKTHFYDISNWSLNYAYNESFQRNITTDHSIIKTFSGGLMYSFQGKPENVSPFQKISFLKGNSLRLIRDFNFNYLPTSLGFRTNMVRTYSETTLRDLNNPGYHMDTTVNKDFLWNRYYDLGFDLTRSLKLNFNATNIARIDEPEGTSGVVNRELKTEYEHWKDTVWRNILKGGRNTHYQHNVVIDYTIPINKLPLMDWTSARAGYDAAYDWDTGLTFDTLNLGNTINNSNTLRLSGELNFSALYSKIPYFRRITQAQNQQQKNSPQRNQQQNQQNQPPAQNPAKKYKTITYERDKTFLTGGEPKNITHNLATEEVTAKVLDSKGKEIKGKLTVINKNRVSFTTDSTYNNVKILVEGKVEEKPNPLAIIAKSITRIILGVKSFSISWTRTEGTTVPGFLPKSRLFGMSTTNGVYAPGIPFILGYQDKNFPYTAMNNGWLTKSKYLNNPIVFTYNENLSLRSIVEPFPGFKIELTAIRTLTRSQNEYFTADSAGTLPTKPRNSQETGNFSMSFITFTTAFGKLKAPDYVSPTFNKFMDYRDIIAGRLGKQKAAEINKPNQQVIYDPTIDPVTGDKLVEGTNGYGLTSQNVLIPAFMAAYGGQNPHKVTLNRIPSVFSMLPNWRINYEGLSKIGFLDNITRSISLNHAYRCVYTVGNYVSTPDDSLENILHEARDLNYNFIPRLDVSSVSFAEQFGPLIGIDVNFKNSLTAKFEMRKSRNVSLSMANNQIMETTSNELVIGTGYKITDVQFAIKSGNTQKAFKSDLNLKANLSIRDNKTIIRRLTDDPNEPPQPAQGQKVVTINVSADYKLSEKLSLRMFYDRIVNTPLVSLSYPTANTNIGFSVQFSLTQ